MSIEHRLVSSVNDNIYGETQHLMRSHCILHSYKFNCWKEGFSFFGWRANIDIKPLLNNNDHFELFHFIGGGIFFRKNVPITAKTVEYSSSE